MKNINVCWYLLLILGFLFFNSCDKDEHDSCIEGTGPRITDTRDVGNFHSILLEGIGNLYITQGPLQPIIIEAPEEVIEIMETQVDNEVLRIGILRCLNEISQEIDIYITIPDISKIEISGVGNVTIENNLDVEDLNVVLSGVGNIILKGNADFLTINSSGVGNILAYNMVADVCEVFIQGTGFVEVNVLTQLNVRITGTANVFYIGNPTISTEISGTGNVINTG